MYRNGKPHAGAATSRRPTRPRWGARGDDLAAQPDGRAGPAKPWKAANADQWDSQTIETWIHANMHTRRGAVAARSSSIEGVYGAEARDVSLLDLLVRDPQRRRGRRSRSSATPRAIRFVGGTQQFSERLAAKLGERVVLGPRCRDDPTQATAGSCASSPRDGRVARPSGCSSPCRRRWSTGSSSTRRSSPPTPSSPSASPWARRSSATRSTTSPFWRPPGLSGFVDQRHRPGEDHLRQLAARRQARRARRVLRGRRRQRLLRQVPAGARRHAALECFARYFGPPRPPSAPLPRARLGRGAVHPRRLRLLQPARRDTSIGHVAGRAVDGVHFAASELTRRVGRLHGRRDSLGGAGRRTKSLPGSADRSRFPRDMRPWRSSVRRAVVGAWRSEGSPACSRPGRRQLRAPVS